MVLKDLPPLPVGLKIRVCLSDSGTYHNAWRTPVCFVAFSAINTSEISTRRSSYYQGGPRKWGHGFQRFRLVSETVELLFWAVYLSTSYTQLHPCLKTIHRLLSDGSIFAFYKMNLSYVPWPWVLCLSIGFPQLVRHVYLILSILWNNQQMQLYSVNFIPLLGSLYMFRVFYTPIIRSTIFNCIYSHW